MEINEVLKLLRSLKAQWKKNRDEAMRPSSFHYFDGAIDGVGTIQGLIKDTLKREKNNESRSKSNS